MIAGERPNIVLVLIDDLGWSDVGCYGNDFVDTPHIDQLAAQGVRFTNFYASGAVCSPTRCALQLGQNQARIGITAHIPGHWRPFERVQTPRVPMGLATDTVTIAETLKTAGYRTGYIGKWHLGNDAAHAPDRQGYDESIVINGPHLPGRYRVAGRKDVRPGKDQYRTDFEGEMAERFITTNDKRPYFLMVSPFAVHIPLGAMSTKVNKYRQRATAQGRTTPHPVYAAMIEHCDDLVGRMVAAIEATGKADQTMVVFTSDNGGLRSRYDYREAADDIVSDLAPLRGEKGSLYEGGIRIPCIIKYPRAKARAATTDRVAVSHDLYPTFARIAGATLPHDQTIDGVDLMPVLNDPQGASPRSPVRWHYPHYHHDRPASAIRDGKWKLIQWIDGSGDVALYDLASDIGETHDLSTERPGLTKKMLRDLHEWRTEILARMPSTNPSYDPARAGQWYSIRNGKPIDSDARVRFPESELISTR